MPPIYRSIPSPCSCADHIPAFLRKRDADDRNDRFRSAPYWSNGPDYRGFTPVGLCAWLNQIPLAEAPRSYRDLLAVGVAGCVVDWLRENFIAEYGNALQESDVVAVFVYLMASEEMLRQLGLPSRVLAAIEVAAMRAGAAFKGGRQPGPPVRLASLVEAMRRSLAGISGEHWPEAIEPAIG